MNHLWLRGWTICHELQYAADNSLRNCASFLHTHHLKLIQCQWLPSHLHLRRKWLPPGGNNSLYLCHSFVDWMEGVRIPGAFASKHSNVERCQWFVMDSLANRCHLPNWCSILVVAIMSRIEQHATNMPRHQWQGVTYNSTWVQRGLYGALFSR